MRQRNWAYLAFALAVLSSDPASACRGWDGWPRGDDLDKLGQGLIVVRARLVRSYKDEERQPSIMGTEFGMIYEIKLSAVVKGAKDGMLKPGTSILIRQPPSVCERYVPNHFSKDADRTLVIVQMPDSIFDLVGGED